MYKKFTECKTLECTKFTQCTPCKKGTECTQCTKWTQCTQNVDKIYTTYKM